MNLSPIGQSALDCWNEIPAHFPFVELDEFVVMPNHVHGIVMINKSDPVETKNIQSGETQYNRPVETQYFASLPRNEPKNQFGPQSQNLAAVIRMYKIGVTKFANQNNIPFRWQARYHDHIIRNVDEHARIQR